MANYQNLIAEIQQYIYNNTSRAITGNILQQRLTNMVSILGGYRFMGIVSAGALPSVQDYNMFYFATEAGTYTYNGNIVGTVVSGELAIFMCNGTWSKLSVFTKADKQDTLVSGTNIKTVNNQSLLGSGNIDIQGGSSNVFIARYTSTAETTTTFADIYAAINAGKAVVCFNDDAGGEAYFLSGYDSDSVLFARVTETGYIFALSVNSDDEWTPDEFGAASADDLLEYAKQTEVDAYADFSISTAYSVGNIVRYEGNLYKFTAAKSAGAWDATKVTQTNVMALCEKLSNKKTSLTNSDTDYPTCKAVRAGMIFGPTATIDAANGSIYNLAVGSTYTREAGESDYSQIIQDGLVNGCHFNIEEDSYEDGELVGQNTLSIYPQGCYDDFDEDIDGTFIVGSRVFSYTAIPDYSYSITRKADLY